MTDPQPAPSPGDLVAAYHRGAPGYPAAAAQWLTGGPGRTVLELGAGTGRLTGLLVQDGHDVHATDPDAAMLEVLAASLPGVRTSCAGAEELPVPDRSVDVVVCAQSFDRFETDRALPEIARVLKPGGHLALVWNQTYRRIPWVRRLDALIGDPDPGAGGDPAAALRGSELFGSVDEAEHRHWQDINRESILDLAASRSGIAALDEQARAARLAEIAGFYDDYGRGMDGMQLPYVARCVRAQVLDDGRADSEPAQATSAADAASQQGPSVSDGSDTDMLLIDFR